MRLLLRYYAGLDLGKAQDYSALAIIESPAMDYHGIPPTYEVRHLERWPLGTNYTQVVAEVDARMRMLPVRGCPLIVDATGVGRAVVEAFRDRMRQQMLYAVIPVLITSGQAVRYNDKEDMHNVPKADLVAELNMHLLNRRLTVVPSLAEVRTLRRELENFQVKTTASGRDTFAAGRSADHDDLVMALAQAVWWAGQEILGLNNQQVISLPALDLARTIPTTPRSPWER